MRNKCRFPQMRPDGTKKIAPAPQPSKKYPVNRATFVKSFEKSRDIVIVLAARIGPSAVARIPAKQSRKVIRSRRKSDQFNGSFGSSEG